MSEITKNAFLAQLECPTQGYRSLRHREEISEAAQFRITQGKEIGKLAQTLYPNSVSLEMPGFEEACSATVKALKEPEASAFFEAAFAAEGFRARADILIREPEGWHLIEVKSKTTNTKDIPDVELDIAYTRMVMTLAGYSVQKTSALLVNADYRRGDPLDTLFVPIDLTEQSAKHMAAWHEQLDSIKENFARELPPSIKSCCRNCMFLPLGCLSDNLSQHILTIPNLRGKKLDQLVNMGVSHIADVPTSADLTANQRRVVDVVQSGKSFVSPELGKSLTNFKWPLYFLDFETVTTTLPLYDDLAPFEQCLTQFSVHALNQDGQLSHADYLALPETDCRFELAGRLVKALGASGSILVYSAFEKTQINNLKKQFPSLGTELEAIVERLVDLLPIFRDHYYHPDFQGKYTIKRVLPATLPAFSYDGLAVKDGETAVAKFARMARGEIPANQIELTRKDLLSYCHQDTMAMVLLIDALYQIAGMPAIYTQVGK